MAILKDRATVIGRMVTILRMVAVLGLALVLRMVNVLVIVRAAIWTPMWFHELYLMFIYKIWDRQTDRV